VAYPYTIYDTKDYRKAFHNLEKAFGVKFIFADQQITDAHILDKIVGYIRGTKFGIYDITSWNANVTLELGIAFGLQKNRYIIFNPSHTQGKILSDIAGFDRIDYTSFSSLEEGLTRLLSQEFPVENRTRFGDQLAEIQDDIMEALADSEFALGINDLAKAIGVTKELCRIALNPLLENEKVEMIGRKRGAAYRRTDGK